MKSPALPPPPSLNELLAASPVALFLDFDGTLIEIASGPDAIKVPTDIAQRLTALAQRLSGRLALISGRGLDNIEQHIGALNFARAGSHGAERIDGAGKPLGQVPQALDAKTIESLRNLAAKHDVLFEGKRHGAALHYRSAPASGPTIEQAATAIAKQSGLTAKRGKCVIELVRRGANKGSALAAFMDTIPFIRSVPVFIGDDVTDEDGFAAAKLLGGFGIAVGERPSDNADFKLETVKDVHAWLTL